MRAREPVLAEVQRAKPTHAFIAIGRTGWKKPTQPQSVDHLQSPDSAVLDSNVQDNLYAPLAIALVAQRLSVHCTYFGTSTMFNYDPLHASDDARCAGFTESDEPNFAGNHYSVVKQYTDRTLRELHAASGSASTFLNLRFTLPISRDRSPRSLLQKLIGFKSLNGPLLPNSISVLPTLFPASAVPAAAARHRHPQLHQP